MKDASNTEKLSEVHSLLVKEESSSWIGQGLESLVISIGILFIVYLVLRVLKDKSILKGFREPDQDITIETIKPVSLQTKLMVIRWQGKEYLISESKNGCSVIDNREVSKETDEK